MALETRAILDSELSGCIEFWKKEWQSDPVGYFERYFYGDHDFIPTYTRVLELEGKISATAHIVKRIVSCGDARLTVGGIANVVVAPALRGAGLGSTVVREAVQLIDADAMDLALLFADMSEFYAKAGFEPVSVQICTGTRNTNLADTSLVLRDATPQDYSAIHRIYGEFNAGRPIAVQRHDAYWRDWIGLTDDPPFCVKVVERKQGVVGYLFWKAMESDDNEVEVFEVGFTDGNTEVVEKLLSSFSPGARVSFLLPNDEYISNAISQFYQEVERLSIGDVFVQFLNLESLLFGLLFDLHEKWVTSGSPAGKLSVLDGETTVILEPVNGFLTVTREAGVVEGAIGHSELFRLLMGWGVSDLVDNYVTTLFPGQAGWFWKLDCF